MGSKHSPSPETKFRFGFSGPVRRGNEERVSVDDILDSLGRRSQLSDRLEEAGGIDFDGGEGSKVPLGLPDSIALKARRSAFGKFVLALLMMAGVVVLWFHGALNAILDPAMIGRLTQSLVSSSAFSDPVRLAILVIVCFVPVLFLKRRRSARDRLLRR